MLHKERSNEGPWHTSGTPKKTIPNSADEVSSPYVTCNISCPMKIELTARLSADDMSEIELWLRTIIKDELSHFKMSSSDHPSETTTPALLNSKEAAMYLRVSPITVWRLRQEGKLSHYRVGNRLLFSVEDHLKPFLDGVGSGR